MAEGQAVPLRVGRIMVNKERAGRMADETARDIRGEIMRSGFAISNRHVLTAWHCVREPMDLGESLWFRLRCEEPLDRQYAYVPLRVTNYDTDFDVAALAVDERRLAQSGLSATEISSLLEHAAIPLGVDVYVGDQARLVGFPASATGADSDTNIGEVVETSLPLGFVTGLKLYCAALAAVDPVDPHGLSGGPVLRHLPGRDDRSYSAVAVIRAAPIGATPGVASGGGLVATRLQDVAQRLPEVGQALDRTTPVPQAPVAHGGNNALAMCRTCGQVLRESQVTFDDPALGRLVGWPHFLHEAFAGQRPTAFGTAYGLKLSLVLGEQDGGLDRGALAETLWKLRVPDDGGWAARTGSGISRPEVSALVLGTLMDSGFDATRLTQAADVFEESLSPEHDPAGITRTYVVSAVVRGLVRVRPQSHRLKELRAILLEGAIEDPERENLLCWPSTWLAKRDQLLTPSVAHTAMAVVALTRVARVLAEDAPVRSALSQAVRWLALNRGLENQTEQIRRPVTAGHWDSLTVRHFTAAWVAKALLATSTAESPQADSLLAEAIGRVWRSQRGGAWEWDDSDRPVWMTYQGIGVIRDYALRAWAPS